MNTYRVTASTASGRYVRTVTAPTAVQASAAVVAADPAIRATITERA